jgi:hypothetical protein
VKVLAVVASSSASEDDLAETLRALVGLHAAGHEVSLFEWGAGEGALSPDATLPAETERALEALAEDGVVPSRPSDLGGAIARTDALWVLSDPERTRVPALLRLSRGARPTDDALAALPRAGCVVVE